MCDIPNKCQSTNIEKNVKGQLPLWQLPLNRVAGGIPTQQKSQTAENENSVPEYFFMLQSDWLKFQIELNSL